MIFTFDPHALRNLNFQLHKRVQTGEIDKRQGHYLRNAPQQVIDNWAIEAKELFNFMKLNLEAFGINYCRLPFLTW